MDLRQLHYFVTVADEGSFSKAAKLLNMTQPPLSIQIRLLEEESGCLLFDRNTRSLKLTDAGQLLYARANAILNLVNNTAVELKDLNSGTAGTIQIGVISSICSTFFAQKLSAFALRHPHVQFQIFEANTYELIEKVRSHQLEFAFVRTPFQAPDLACIHLKKDSLAAIAGTDYFDDVTDSISLKQLCQKPLIIYRRWEAILRNEFAKAGLDPVITCTCDDARSAAYFAKAGMGVALIPRSVTSLIESTELCVKEISGLQISTDISVIYSKTAYMSAASRIFLAELTS